MLNQVRTASATLPADRRHVLLHGLRRNLHACIHNLHHHAAYTTASQCTEITPTAFNHGVATGLFDSYFFNHSPTTHMVLPQTRAPTHILLINLCGELYNAAPASATETCLHRRSPGLQSLPLATLEVLAPRSLG